MQIQAKRVYESPSLKDGKRYLVERLWPRGMRKEALRMDAWLKDVAPSAALRAWYAHDVAKWKEFQRRYRRELDANPDAVGVLTSAARAGPVTLLYAAHDEEHNSAVVLAVYLKEKLHA